LGIHFAITPETVEKVLNAQSDIDKSNIIQQLESVWGWNDNDPWVYQTDKAWDGIHRCLTDGSLDSGHGPLAKFILGGTSVYKGSDYIMCLISPEDAHDAATAAKELDEAWLRSKYFKLSEDDVGYPIHEDDFEYTWENFRGLPGFFQRAADAGKWLLFTASQ